MNENIEPKPLGVDNSRVIRAFGQEAHVLISSEQTGEAFCLFLFFASPGNVAPSHLHRAIDETFLIESGEIEINRSGELHGRRGRHLSSLRNSPCAKGYWERRGRGGRGVRAGGFDRFFAACAEEFMKGELEMPLLINLAAEYGIEFQSGPPS